MKSLFGVKGSREIVFQKGDSFLTLSLPRVTSYILLCLTPDNFTHQRETPLGSKGLKYRLKILTFLPSITEPLILVMEATVISGIIFTSPEHSKFNLTMPYV